MTTELTKAAQQALMECPFCGSEPHDAHHIEYGRWAVTCRCGAKGASANTGPNATDAAKIKAYSDARTAWNTRALAQRPAAQADDHGEQLTKAKRLLVDLHKIGGEDVRIMIEARTGPWFVWGQDRASLPAPQQATPEPDDDGKWRDVALRFDKHRMQALWHLQAMLKDPAKHADIVRQFLKDPTHPAAATPEPVGWQPIQTAPTDGTKFLGWRRGRVATAYRVKRDDCEMWCFGGQSGAFEHWPETRPEFWMPHPPEPALAAQAKGGEQ